MLHYVDKEIGLQNRYLVQVSICYNMVQNPRGLPSLGTLLPPEEEANIAAEGIGWSLPKAPRTWKGDSHK